ncbi:MAG: indole-3-glycerol phosphate synthase TrpC [Alphaproteobacteria bacterium]|nr:indole-3-glycerol phosphate synthase TrpC [Alphaproteobacteria bacterium]
MTDTLAEICAKKREHIAAQKLRVSAPDIHAKAADASPTRGFKNALLKKQAAHKVGLIAELKKASPSRGLIRANFEPATLAKAYEKGGAACLSVLTDAPYFQGDDAYLAQARGAVALPILRKDFMLEPYQIFESRALGADCILLIMAALSDAEASELEAIATELKMDVLVEVHNAEELERALAINPQNSGKILGINNRNLKTLKVDIATTEELAPMAANYLLVCESGIKTNDDVQRMGRAGVSTFLVGESLMAQSDVALATRQLLGE